MYTCCVILNYRQVNLLRCRRGMWNEIFDKITGSRIGISYSPVIEVFSTSLP